MTTPVRIAHVTTVDLTLRFLLLAQLEALRDAGFEVSAISAPGPWGDDVRARGITVIDWPSITRRWDPGADRRAFRELLAILRRERFDLVHTHTPKVGVLGRLAARIADVPCVVNTVHGLYATRDDRFVKRVAVLGLEGAAARTSDLELYQSEEDPEVDDAAPPRPAVEGATALERNRPRRVRSGQGAARAPIRAADGARCCGRRRSRRHGRPARRRERVSSSSSLPRE